MAINPEEVQEALEAMRQLAAGMREYYESLIAAGFTEEQAFKMTCEFQRGPSRS